MSVLSLLLRRQAFGPSCPSGGNFYACENGTNFVGCCDEEPCEDGCSNGNLKPASFDPSYYGKFKDQECPSGSSFYTCAYTDPPFMGCCKTNACTDGCPLEDVTSAFLSSNDKIAADFLTSKSAATSTESSSTESSTSRSSSSALTDISSALSSPASSPTQPSSVSTSLGSSFVTQTTTAAPSNGSNTGTIAGASVGGVVAVGLLLALLTWFIKRKAKDSGRHMALGRVGTWGSGKEAVPTVDKVKDGANSFQDPKDGSPQPPELMSSPAPTFISFDKQPVSELDAARTLQRPKAISPQLSQASSSPQMSPPSPGSRQQFQVWGNDWNERAYRDQYSIAGDIQPRINKSNI